MSGSIAFKLHFGSVFARQCSHAITASRFTQRNMLVAHISRHDLLRSSVAAFAKIPDSLIERNIAIV